MLTLPPLVILAISVVIVLGMILVLRLNAFLALITAAMTVSLLAPVPAAEEGATIKDTSPVARITRVAERFGSTAGKIGIPIAMAAVIGSCLTASGAADRIVRSTLSLFGEKHSAAALSTSGFLLAVPVFFDTVFFLLAPIARSMYRASGRNYLKCLLALGSGAAVAHTLVPPTPGPLLVAEQLGVDVGRMMIFGFAVGVPMTLVAMLYAAWIDRRLPSIKPPEPETTEVNADSQPLPGLAPSLAPIVLPVVFIAGHTVLQTVAKSNPSAALARVTKMTALLGDPNFALSLAAAVALWFYLRHLRPSRHAMSSMVDHAITSAGVIILITAAGGAFGGMLKEAQVGAAIESLFASEPPSDTSAGTSAGGLGGMALLWLAFGIASLLKVSQGSSTVAMITSGAMLSALVAEQPLPFDPVYVALAIGCGAMVGVWMNDSGFWVFCRMGGLTESEALQTWTPMLAISGFAGMAVTLLLAWLLPMTPG